MTTKQPTRTTTVLPASDSDPFTLLDPGLQRWVWDQGWRQLRDAQQQAVRPILSGDTDVIISAATASGKTEAAFLPINTRLASQDKTAGIDVLYISPLKALINDQTGRLEELCERVDIPVYRWHGDVSSSVKDRAMKSKGGVLLITPESLEAIFVRRGTKVDDLLQNLQYVVIDELHAFLDSDRGRQLQSLLHRVELRAKKRVPRIGLSATLSDLTTASKFMRPEDGESVVTIRSRDDVQDLRMQLLAFTGSEYTNHEAGDDEVSTAVAIAAEVFKRTVGTHSLVFANSRQRVEEMADLLTQVSERNKVPNQYFPHHGNLAKDVREDVEQRLQNASQPATAVCTSTLELGIDIGSMESVIQVGPPPAVSSLRQRLGRAGRRGEPAVLRIYISEGELSTKAHPFDQMRIRTVETIAMIQLLLQRWYEPAGNGRFDFSTLVQQTMSLIAERNGVRPAEAHKLLCGPGPFESVSPNLYAELLRDMGQNELIMQTSDYQLLLAPVGERIVNNFEFYTAFVVPKEFRLVANGKSLGQLPITYPVFTGALLVFSGRRWKVNSVDDQNKVIDLSPAAAGAAPKFGGEIPPLDRRIHEQMKMIYESSDVPAYLAASSRELLTQGRSAYAGFDLSYNNLIQFGNEAVLFHWAGDRAGQTLAIALGFHDIRATNEGAALVAPRTEIDQLAEALKALQNEGPMLPQVLADTVSNKRSAKYDWVLSDDLANLSYSSQSLDIDGAWDFLNALH